MGTKNYVNVGQPCWKLEVWMQRRVVIGAYQRLLFTIDTDRSMFAMIDQGVLLM